MRKDKTEYYLDMADVASTRGTCLRRNYGAVIVKDDRIIATGYTGAPRGRKNCEDIGFCTREKLNVPSGQRYELCRSVHAEQNAVIQADGQKTIGATIYVVGHDAKSGALCDGFPCAMCKRVIINAGIEKAVVRLSDGTYTVLNVADWVADDEILTEV